MGRTIRTIRKTLVGIIVVLAFQVILIYDANQHSYYQGFLLDTIPNDSATSSVRAVAGGDDTNAKNAAADKFVRSSVISKLMNPDAYNAPVPFDEFPVCQTERQQCELGKNATAILEEYFAAKPPPEKIPLPLEEYYDTKNGNATNTTTIRVLMDVPDWWNQEKDKLAQWENMRNPKHCMGISCDARFGTFSSLTKTEARVKFGKFNPVQASQRNQWKPHIYMHRLGLPKQYPGQLLWDYHRIAFALESGESCSGTACQFGRSNIFSNPATILAAISQGDIISLVVSGGLKKLEDLVTIRPPPTLADFPIDQVPYYSGLFVSNCGRPLRNRWLKGLMDHLPIVSYGNCPRKTPGFSCSRNSKCSKIEEAGKYPFHIALENDPMLPGYITEKVYEAYISNSLPVIWSGAEINAYFPRHSFIDVRNFTTPQELAMYLRHVRNDTKLYDSYFAWRRDPQEVASLLRQYNAAAKNGPEKICGICHAFVQKFVE